MLDANLILLACCFILAFTSLFMDRQYKKVKRQLSSTMDCYGQDVTALNKDLAAKGLQLAGEMEARKKTLDLLDKTKLDGDAAKAKMILLNDALNISREQHENTKKECGTLVEEVVTLNTKVDTLEDQVDELQNLLVTEQTESSHLRSLVESKSMISVTRAKKVAKKSSKKKRV